MKGKEKHRVWADCPRQSTVSKGHLLELMTLRSCQNNLIYKSNENEEEQFVTKTSLIPRCPDRLFLIFSNQQMTGSNASQWNRARLQSVTVHTGDGTVSFRAGPTCHFEEERQSAAL